MLVKHSQDVFNHFAPIRTILNVVKCLLPSCMLPLQSYLSHSLFVNKDQVN